MRNGPTPDGGCPRRTYAAAWLDYAAWLLTAASAAFVLFRVTTELLARQASPGPFVLIGALLYVSALALLDARAEQPAVAAPEAPRASQDDMGSSSLPRRTGRPT